MEKRRVFAAIVAAALLGAVAVSARLWSANDGGEQPTAIVSLPVAVRDLGRTDERKRWEIEFPIQNSGTRRLVLNEVDDCRCRDTPGRTIVVSPGETVDLIVSLDTRSITGPVEKTASFTTSDPTRPRLDLTVQAFVVAAATDEPTLAPGDRSAIPELYRTRL